MYLASLVPRVGSKWIVTHSGEGIARSTTGQSVTVAATTAAATAATRHRCTLLGAAHKNSASCNTTAHEVSLLRASTQGRLLARCAETRLLQHTLESLSLESVHFTLNVEEMSRTASDS